MTTTTGLDSRIESYLARVRVGLRGLPEREVDDILFELHTHIAELAAETSGVEVALQSLGDPIELAKTYRAENQMVQAECSGSPLVILQGLRHATLTRLGRIAATALYIFGYINLFTLWSAALEKLLSPSRGGLWYVPGHWSSITLITGGNPPPGARELLGWWLVPTAVLVGWAFKLASDQIAQWWIARYRRSKASQGV